MMKKTMTPASAYIRMRLGPAFSMLAPAPRKRPTPIAPPMAIICTWRLPSPRS